MHYEIAGEACSIPVEFILDGEYVTPDVNSVHYTIYGNDGITPITGYQLVVVPTTSETTHVSIKIPQDVNITTGDIEARYLEVTFTNSGRPHRLRIVYRLVPRLPITVSPEDVRQYIGLSPVELPDTAVDLVQAYFALRRRMNDDGRFTAAFVATDDRAYLINQALVYIETLRLIPSLQLRVMESGTVDSQTVTRLKNIDFEALRQTTLSLLGTTIELTGEAIFVDPLFIALSTPIDPITGV